MNQVRQIDMQERERIASDVLGCSGRAWDDDALPV